MLHQYAQQFLGYCQIACFSERSLRTLTARLKKVNVFIKSKRLKLPKEIAYTHLIDFISDFKLPSVHVNKSRVWTVKQFYHFLVSMSGHQKTLPGICRIQKSRGRLQNGPWNQVYALPFPKLIRVKRRRAAVTQAPIVISETNS